MPSKCSRKAAEGSVHFSPLLHFQPTPSNNSTHTLSDCVDCVVVSRPRPRSVPGGLPPAWRDAVTYVSSLTVKLSSPFVGWNESGAVGDAALGECAASIIVSLKVSLKAETKLTSCRR